MLGRATSTSYVPGEGAAHQQFIFDLQQLYQHNRDERGLVRLVYHISVFLAQPLNGMKGLGKILPNL